MENINTGMPQHYRFDLVERFKNAKEDSINLKDFQQEFQNPEEIVKAQEALILKLKKGVDFNNVLEITALTREIQDKVLRAALPLHYVNYAMAAFGSARTKEGDEAFKRVKNITEALTFESKIDVITGGGPGIMDAASQGFQLGAKKRITSGKQNRSKSIGLTVTLPFEEKANPNLDINSKHESFGTRFDEFANLINSSYSDEGGGGTDVENRYIYQLLQVQHLEKEFPMILRKSMWEKMEEQMYEKMYFERVKNHQQVLISPEDVKKITFLEHTDDIIQKVLDHYENFFKKHIWSKLDGNSQEWVMNSRIQNV